MKNTNILKPFVLFSFLLFYSFLIIGCSGEGEKDLSVYKDRATFENYLTEKINSYVEEHTSDLLDEETNIFTLQPARMFWQSFFEEDDQRINHWYEVALDNGLSSDSINSMINREIDIYNTYHKDASIEHINISHLSSDEIIDDNAYSVIKQLEYFGAYDLIDLLFGSFITFYVGFAFGYLIAIILDPVLPDTSDEFDLFMAKLVGYLFFILWIGLFCWLTYKYIVTTMELESVISSNIINAITF